MILTAVDNNTLKPVITKWNKLGNKSYLNFHWHKNGVTKTFPKWVVMTGLDQPWHYIIGARTNDFKISSVTMIYGTHFCKNLHYSWKNHMEEELQILKLEIDDGWEGIKE